MRIAFVTYNFGEYSILHASALARHGTVALWMPEGLAAPHLDKLDPSVAFTPFEHPRLRHAVRQWRSIRTIVRQVHEFRPDVIHFQHGHQWFNLALPLLRRFPLVLTVHDPQQHAGDRSSRRTWQRVMHFGYRRATRLITHAQQMRRSVIDLVGIDPDRIDVVPHVAIGEAPDCAAVEEEENLVLFFGRIWEYKGLDYLIRAEPRITARVPDARIMIAGRGDKLEGYRSQMIHPERFLVRNQWISYQERAEMFQRASLVVLPYTESTQSGVIPVAYTFSKPVVATRTGGLPEMVDDGETGYLVPPRDESALADAIVRLLQNKKRRRAMGTAGRRKLDSQWSPEIVAEQTFEVYQRAVREFRHRPERHVDRNATQPI